MPSIDLYLDSVDGQLLLDWLNSNDEVAFVLGGSRAAPRLAENRASLPAGDHLLFHNSYKSIPMYPPLSEGDKAVSEELYSLMRMRPPEPLSGVDKGHPAIFCLGIRYTQRSAKQEAIGLSHIAWTGNRYASLGLTATPESKRWWGRFKAWIARNARKVSRSGPLGESPKDLWVWAFPSALASIETGALRADNPL